MNRKRAILLRLQNRFEPNTGVKIAFVWVLFGVLAACNRSEPSFTSYVRPHPRQSLPDPTCEGLAHAHPEATWSPKAFSLRIANKGFIAIADASVLGGPFEPPIRIEVPSGEHSIRLLLGKTPAGEGRPLCAEIRLSQGPIATWRTLGDVPIDTDVVAIVDEARYREATRTWGADVYAGVEATSSAIGALVQNLGREGIVLEPVLPTYFRTTRPVLPTDRTVIQGALTALHIDGRYVEEPQSTGYFFVQALGEHIAAPVKLSDSIQDAAIAIESPQGDGAYAVTEGLDDTEKPIVAEIRLAP